VTRVLVNTCRRRGRVLGPVLRDLYGEEVAYPHVLQDAGAAQVSGAAPGTVGRNAAPDRDRWELARLTAALNDGLPVLAVCRGMQLLNIASGGTLHGHMTGSPRSIPRSRKR
jgi:Peptidase C26